MSACLLYRPQGRPCPTGFRPHSAMIGGSPITLLTDGEKSGFHTPRYGVTSSGAGELRRIAGVYGVGWVLGRSAKLALWTVRRRASFYVYRRGPEICGLQRSLLIEGGAAWPR